MKKYVPEFSGFNPDDVSAFCKDFLAGNLVVRIITGCSLS